MDQLYADGATMITAFWRPTDPWWTGMTTLIPFVSQGNNYILQYNPTDGTTGIDRINADFSGTTATWRPSAKLWLGTQITLCTFQGVNYVLQYSAQNATMNVDQINADGSGVTNMSQPVPQRWDTGLTIIVPVVVPQ